MSLCEKILHFNFTQRHKATKKKGNEVFTPAALGSASFSYVQRRTAKLAALWLVRIVSAAHYAVMYGSNASADLEALAAAVIDCGYKLHVDLGPGLLESVYEAILCHMLEQRGMQVERQKAIPIVWHGMVLSEGFRADLIVNNALLVEIKSLERCAPVHGKQVLTYLRLLSMPLGLLLNFGGATFREGVRRIANDYYGLRPQSRQAAE